MKDKETAKVASTRISAPLSLETDEVIDVSLRPTTLAEYIGQEKIKGNLEIFIQAAKKRRDTLDHVLLYGPPGLGKTTLGYIMAKEMGVDIKITSGPVIERAGDLVAILTNLQDGDVLFIDEIHRLPHIVEEVLYPAMEDFNVDIVIGQGPSARSLKLPIPRFSLVGATTKAGMLTSPLRDRFGMSFRLDFYASEELARIVHRSALILGTEITPAGALEIARRSRGTPRIANRILKRVRDYAQVRGSGVVDEVAAQAALQLFEIDSAGLDHMDRRILYALIEKFDGGPAGLDNIAAVIGEESSTIEDVYEPYLIQEGFLQRTPRGRIASRRAFAHLNVPLPEPLKKVGTTGELFA